MPSSDFVREAQAERTGNVVTTLLTLDHPNIGTPLRVTDDKVQTISRGETFIPYPFSARLARNSADTAPSAQLAIGNIDRQIVLALRALPLEPPVSVLIEEVLSSDPEVVERSMAGFELRSADYDAQRVTGALVLDTLDREPFPAIKYLPSTCPGVF